jgi:16S rRNA (adenine1518-N6/adenine1519-N6)-dimethyltransferase
MPPNVFWPMPKVDSAIVRIVVDPAKRATIPDLKYFHQFVKTIFIHRRKFLRANVVAAMKEHLSKGEIDEILGQMELPEETRTEQLDVATLSRLTELVRVKAPAWTL